MKIELLKDETASSINEAVQVVLNQHQVKLIRLDNDIQPLVNIISYFGEKIAYQVRITLPYNKIILCAFWVPIYYSKVQIATKMLNESNHDSFLYTN